MWVALPENFLLTFNHWPTTFKCTQQHLEADIVRCSNIFFLVVNNSYRYCNICDLSGRTVARVVKALDSQPQHRGFESHTLSLRYLESLARLVPEMCSSSHSRKMRTWQHTEKAIVHWSHMAPCSVYPGCMLRWGFQKVLVCPGVPGVIIYKVLRAHSRIKHYIRTAYYLLFIIMYMNDVQNNMD